MGEVIKRVPGRPFRCPQCDGRDVRPSVLRGLDFLFVRFHYDPYRCRACEKRFYRHVTLEPGLVEEQDMDDLKPTPGGF